MDAAAHTKSPRLVILARDIKLSHSIFALPFALLAAYLAASDGGYILHRNWMALLLILVCMVLARTVAMTVNRLADSQLDAQNPRTAERAIPSGKLSFGYVLTVAILCAAGFIIAAGGFWLVGNPPNRWPLILSPLVLVWLGFYSFTKRFTSLSHLFLGSALGLSPLAAVTAVNPAYLSQPAPYLLALMVICWVAGFDVIYALQDVQADRRQGLHSLPARLGVEPALWISRGLHLLALGALIATGSVTSSLGTGFAAGVVIVASLLILEHALVWGSKTHHIDMAFFTANGLISLLLGVLGIVDTVRAVA